MYSNWWHGVYYHTILQTFGESVSTVCGGKISSSSPEVAVSTYSGQIYGLTRGSSNKLPGSISAEVKAKIEALKLVLNNSADYMYMYSVHVHVHVHVLTVYNGQWHNCTLLCTCIM